MLLLEFNFVSELMKILDTNGNLPFPVGYGNGGSLLLLLLDTGWESDSPVIWNPIGGGGPIGGGRFGTFGGGWFGFSIIDVNREVACSLMYDVFGDGDDDGDDSLALLFDELESLFLLNKDW